MIDLWWELAGALGIPYEDGLWSGPVRIERPPATGAGNVLGQSADADGGARSRRRPARRTRPRARRAPSTGRPADRAATARSCCPNGLAAAPADAPLAVKEIIAAGNQIVGKPYLYGGGHGLPLSEIAPSYDCSSSVEHLLYGARPAAGRLRRAVGDARVVRRSPGPGAG